VTSPGLAKEALLQEKLNQLESVNSAMQAEAKHLQELLEGTPILDNILNVYQSAVSSVSEYRVFAVRRKVSGRQLAEETFRASRGKGIPISDGATDDITLSHGEGCLDCRTRET
jgi:hypothetical protein